MAHPIILAIAGLALTGGGSKRGRPSKTRRRGKTSGKQTVRHTKKSIRGTPPVRRRLPDIEEEADEQPEFKLIRPNFAEISKRSAPNQLGGMSLTADGQHGAVSPNWWVIHQHRVISKASEDLNWSPGDSEITAEEIALEIVKREAPDFDWSTIGEDGWAKTYPGAQRVFLAVLGHIEQLIERVASQTSSRPDKEAIRAADAARDEPESEPEPAMVEAEVEEPKPKKTRKRRKRKSKAQKEGSDVAGDADASSGEGSGPDTSDETQAEAG